ncbi:MAG: hypothetical protein QOD93_2941 [Acetobacteraceae bacterium]|jgi:hypothetical protein|nr:hypothetical protein [Acetobacteraceae bacterium]
MPVKHIRDVDIVYEVLGDSGPWVTVTPGRRRGLIGGRDQSGRYADNNAAGHCHSGERPGASAGCRSGGAPVAAEQRVSGGFNAAG